MRADVVWSLLTAVVMVIGLLGVVVPVLPGLVLIWAAALVYGFLVGWTAIGVIVMVVTTALLAASFALGVVLPKREATASGASGLAQLGGLTGAVIGLFLIPVVGIIVGALIGVIVVEMLAKKNWPDAWAATKGVARGFGKSVLVDLLIGTVMWSLWALWALTVIF